MVMRLEEDINILKKKIFFIMLRKPGAVTPHVDLSFVERDFAKRLTFSKKFFEQIGLPTDRKELGDAERKALASSIQTACAELVNDLAGRLCRQYGIKQVCLAGGLFQNSLLVAEIEKHLG